MRILVDGSIFQIDFGLGVQRYFREVLGRIGERAVIDLYLDDPPAVDLPERCNISYRKEWFKAPRYSLPHIARAIRRRIKPTRFGGHDVFHSTAFSLSPEPGIPEVFTLHDMIAELHGDLCESWAKSAEIDKLRAMNSAQIIICISNATADDLRRVYPQLSAKIRVIYHGADHLWHPEGADAQASPPLPAGLDAPYALFVGLRWQYKNFKVVLDAMSQAAWDRELKLVIVGSPLTVEEQADIERRGLAERIQVLGRIDDQLLRRAYAHAAFFVFPSRAEGFGFPLLEAQLAGAAVLCSDMPVFREIAGESATYFDPIDPAHLASAASGLFHQGKDAQKLDAGRRNAMKYRWDDCARETFEVYKEATASYRDGLGIESAETHHSKEVK